MVAAFSPGLGASVDMQFLIQAKSIYASYIQNCIKIVEMPDYGYDQGQMGNNSFAINSNSQPQDISIKVNPDANGFDV